jgi:transposase
MRYELTDHEWTAIKPTLPNKPRGAPRVRLAGGHSRDGYPQSQEAGLI